jgi:hypothetical protein
MQQLDFHCTNPNEILYLSVFILRKSAEKIQFSLKSEKNNGTLHEDQYTFLISRSFILRMRNVLCKSYRVFQNKTRVLFSITFYPKSCRLWDNVERFYKAGQATDDTIIRRMRIACWIPEATDTHSEYLMLTAFPQWQWLRERASMSRWTCVACLVFSASLRQAVITLHSDVGK